MNLGCGAYQEYTLDRYQTKLLRETLQELLDTEEIYIEN